MTDPKIHEALSQVIDDAIANGSGYLVDDIAAAVLELVGPKPLKWVNMGGTSRASFPSGGYAACAHDHDDVALAIHDGSLRVLSRYPTLEAAKARAQARADLGHWTNTNIGDLTLDQLKRLC